MTPTNGTPNTLTNARPLPPDQISPKSVILRIAQIKHVARRNWKLLLVITLIAGSIGLAYDLTHQTRPTYNAIITFNLGGGSSGSGFGGELGQLAGAFGLSAGAPDANIFVGDNFIIYAKSRPVVEKTLMKMDTINGKDTLLVNYYIRHSGIRDDEWADSDTLRSFYFKRSKKPEEYTKLEQLAMTGIYARIKGEMGVSQPERKSSFMELRCAMEDEQLAANFLTTHLTTIEEDYRQKQTKKTSEMYTLLRERADSVARILTGTENRLAQYMDQNSQVVVAQGRLLENKLSRNSTFLTQLYYTALQAADNMRLTLIKEAPLFTIIEPVTFPLYKDQKSQVGMQAGIALGLFLAMIIIFFRETYRSIMREE
ncbi:hypothetical protein ACFSUS_02200 [Spirosoma soli]|uniref:Lipopolysaccharide biosynthesis protein n=1 Tax=Spirosoma soli TaxID=1770529 RepID=A0ABW5LZF3_9BACT